MAAIPQFNFLITARNLTGGAISQVRGALGGLISSAGAANSAIGGIASQSGSIAGDFFRAQIAVDAWRFALGKVNEAIGFVKNGFAEATNLQNEAIIAASTFSALTGSTYDQAATALENLNNRLAKSAAILPGATQDYKALATSVNDNLIEAFKDASGKLDVKAWEDATASISESFGAITASSTKMIGNTSLGLTKALGGSSIAELRSIALFEQNPVLLNELERGLAEKNAKTLADLSIVDRVNLIKSVGEKFISGDFKSAASQSVDGLIQSFKSAIFDPSSGIFGLMRDLDEQTKGTQSVFSAYNETVNLFVGSNSLFSNISELITNLGLTADPMAILEKGFKLFNSLIKVVVDSLAGINKVLSPMKSGANAAKNAIAETAKVPQSIGLFFSKLANGASLPELSQVIDIGEILSVIVTNIGRAIAPWAAKTLGITADAIPDGKTYKIDYQGLLVNVAQKITSQIDDQIIKFGQALGQNIKLVLDVGAKVFFATADAIIDAAPQIGEFVGNIASGVVVTLGNLLSGFSEWISLQLPRFFATVRKGIMAIGEFVKNLDIADTVGKFVKSIMPSVNQGAQSIVSAGIPGLINLASQGVSLAVDVLGELSKAIAKGLWEIALNIDWVGILGAIGKGLLNIKWGDLVMGAGKAYLVLLAGGILKSAALAVSGLISGFVGGLSSAALGGLAAAWGGIISGISVVGASITSAILGGIAPISAVISAWFAGISSAISGGLLASAGVILAPLAIFLGAIAVLAGAFLILSGGDVANFGYAVQGWKQSIQELTGVEVASVGDAIAITLTGTADAIGSIVGMIGSYFTLAGAEVRGYLDAAGKAVSGFVAAIVSLPQKAAIAAGAAKTTVISLPGKIAGKAQAIKSDVGLGLKETKSMLESRSGVEIDSIGDAVGVTAYQSSSALADLAKSVFSAIGSELTLTGARVKLLAANFFAGSAWKNWLLGWQTLGAYIQDAPGAIAQSIKTWWKNWLLGWQTLGMYISEAPGLALKGIQSWWQNWLDGWGLLGIHLSSGIKAIANKAVNWGRDWLDGWGLLKVITLGTIADIYQGAVTWGKEWLGRLEEFKSAVGEGIDSIKSWWSGFWDTVGGVLDSIKKVLAGDLDNLKQTWAIISESLSAIPKAIKELLDQVREAIKGFIPNTIASVGNAVATVAAPVTQPIQQAATSVKDVAANVTEGAAKIFDGIGDAISGAMGGMMGENEEKSTSTTPQSILSMFRGHIPNFDSGMLGLIPALLKAASLEKANMPPGAGLAIANTSEYILTPSQMQNILAGMSSSPSPTVSPIGGFLPAIQGIISAVSGMSSSPSPTVSPIGGFLPAIQGIISAVSGMSSSPSPTVSPIGGFLPAIQGIISAVSGMQSRIATEIFPAVPPPVAVPGAIAATSPSPGAGTLSQPTTPLSPQSSGQKTINLGPITINISGENQNPESHAREVLRYIDLFLQEEMLATL
jgi:hypothetical protein